MTAQVDWAKTGIPLLSLASFRSLMLLVDLHHRRSQKFWNEAVYSLKSRSAIRNIPWIVPQSQWCHFSCASPWELRGLGEIRHHSWSTLHPCVDEVHLYPRVLAVRQILMGAKITNIKIMQNHLAEKVDFKLLTWQTRGVQVFMLLQRYPNSLPAPWQVRFG